MILAFDAANTLIYKPTLFTKITEVLNGNGYQIDNIVLQKNHKLISEIINFPDKTSEDFYIQFNQELLYSLGIIPNSTLLKEIYWACKFLPWQPFEDIKELYNIPGRKFILSNFHNGLNKIILDFFPDLFEQIIISEEEKYRKPDELFYQTFIRKIDVSSDEILYIGDSLKLDIEPALNVGMNAVLIDRNNQYSNMPNKISSFREIKNLL
jgi:putative hydrolase of the HAD superfamily